MTDQLGFVIGCGISTGVQLSSLPAGQWSDRKSRCRSSRARRGLTQRLALIDTTDRGGEIQM
jgi:hypothetical protein